MLAGKNQHYQPNMENKLSQFIGEQPKAVAYATKQVARMCHARAVSEVRKYSWGAGAKYGLFLIISDNLK